jgi:histone acetyltransferase MYST4
MREHHETSHATWLKWLIDAVHKVRHQKQRPSLERIIHAVKQHHQKAEESAIEEHLELCVKEGTVLKVYNKGLVSYKDPGVNSRQLKVTTSTDLTKVIVKALRELGDTDGSPIKSIEKYIRHSHSLDLGVDVDFSSLLKQSVKRAVSRGLVSQEGRLYRPTHLSITGTPQSPVEVGSTASGTTNNTTTPTTTPKKKRNATSTSIEEETPTSKVNNKHSLHISPLYYYCFP